LIPYGATFLIFTDYMRNSIRLSALSETRVIWVMTHDSIALGEDLRLHQPVEHVASLRAIPNLLVMRPEMVRKLPVLIKWLVSEKKRPTLLALSRQNPAQFSGNFPAGVAKGAYVIT
jgi:transketolase